ncbi:unnamed protein product, partial [Phaeothamnion confervicola]
SEVRAHQAAEAAAAAATKAAVAAEAAVKAAEHVHARSAALTVAAAAAAESPRRGSGGGGRRRPFPVRPRDNSSSDEAEGDRGDRFSLPRRGNITAGHSADADAAAAAGRRWVDGEGGGGRGGGASSGDDYRRRRSGGGESSGEDRRQNRGGGGSDGDSQRDIGAAAALAPAPRTTPESGVYSPPRGRWQRNSADALESREAPLQRQLSRSPERGPPVAPAAATAATDAPASPFLEAQHAQVNASLTSHAVAAAAAAASALPAASAPQHVRKGSGEYRPDPAFTPPAGHGRYEHPISDGSRGGSGGVRDGGGADPSREWNEAAFPSDKRRNEAANSSLSATVVAAVAPQEHRYPSPLSDRSDDDDVSSVSDDRGAAFGSETVAAPEIEFFEVERPKDPLLDIIHRHTQQLVREASARRLSFPVPPSSPAGGARHGSVVGSAISSWSTSPRGSTTGGFGGSDRRGSGAAATQAVMPPVTSQAAPPTTPPRAVSPPPVALTPPGGSGGPMSAAARLSVVISPPSLVAGPPPAAAASVFPAGPAAAHRRGSTDASPLLLREGSPQPSGRRRSSVSSMGFTPAYGGPGGGAGSGDGGGSGCGPAMARGGGVSTSPR